MSRSRIMGYIFSGIFALGFGMIGFALTRGYLALPIFKDLSSECVLSPGWQACAYMLFIMLGLLIGLVIGTFLYYRMMDIGKNLRKIPAEDKMAATFGTTHFACCWPMPSARRSRAGRRGETEVRVALIILESVLVIWVFNMIDAEHEG